MGFSPSMKRTPTMTRGYSERARRRARRAALAVLGDRQAELEFVHRPGSAGVTQRATPGPSAEVRLLVRRFPWLKGRRRSIASRWGTHCSVLTRTIAQMPLAGNDIRRIRLMSRDTPDGTLGSACSGLGGCLPQWWNSRRPPDFTLPACSQKARTQLLARAGGCYADGRVPWPSPNQPRASIRSVLSSTFAIFLALFWRKPWKTGGFEVLRHPPQGLMSQNLRHLPQRPPKAHGIRAFLPCQNGRSRV